MIRAKLIVIGLATLASSVGMYAAYLTFSREIREYVFLDPKCLSGWINAAVDNLFELSVLGSLFLVFASVSRWLLIPWLIVYAVDILVMVALTIASLLVPLNNPQFPDWFDSRQLSLPIFGLLTMLSAMWAVVAMEYGKWKRTIPTEAPPGAGPVDMSRRVRLTVNISCGLLALLSSVILVVIHSSLYLTIANFIADKVWDVPNDMLKLGITAFCLTTIVVNLFAIIGASGAKWRRGFMVPWLILYGFMVIILVGMYEWFTSDCYFEHKGYGMVALGFGTGILAIWTCVWLNASDASGDNYQGPGSVYVYAKPLL